MNKGIQFARIVDAMFSEIQKVRNFWKQIKNHSILIPNLKNALEKCSDSFSSNFKKKHDQNKYGDE